MKVNFLIKCLKQNNGTCAVFSKLHSFMGHIARLTSCVTELLNANMFDPRPNEGKNGQPVMIPSHELLKMQQLFQINRFNLMASDRIPLDRSLPDVRKKR